MQYFSFSLRNRWIFKCSGTWYCWLVNSYKWFREACCFHRKAASVYIFSCHKAVMWPFWVWSGLNIKQVVLSVHSVEQKSIGLIFRASHSGSDVRYSCHHNLSHFTFPIFVHLWRFSVFHTLQSITLCIYEPKTTIHLLNLKLKH